MATAAISIVDRLIQLLNVRQQNRAKFFHDFIDPLFQDGERIASDYLAMLNELKSRVASASDDPAEILDWIEERRADLQPLRIKVRALIDGHDSMGRGKHKSTNLVLFRKGLWGVMKGAVSTIEDGHALTPEYGFGGHTVLDILHHGRRERLGQQFREQLTARADLHRLAIERAWAEVATAYAGLKTEYLL